MLLPGEPLSPSLLANELWSPDDIHDARLFERLKTIPALVVSRLEQRTTIVPRALRRGAQRLWNNEDVDEKPLRRATEDRTLQALKQVEHEPVLVFSHDTTECDERQAGDPDDAGPLRSSKARGYLLHYCVVVVPVSKALLGALGCHAWTRSWHLRKGDHDQRAPHDKESIKWRNGVRFVTRSLHEAGIRRRLVHCFDREGDLFETFTFARRHKHEVVVRVSRDRVIAESKEDKLWAYLKKQPVLVTLPHQTDNHVDSKARQAAKKEGKEALARFDRRVAKHGDQRSLELEVRAATVTLKKGKQRVSLQTVYVSEKAPVEGLTVVEWMLFTTTEVRTAAQAQQVKQWYEARWPIEPMNSVLKTGCHLEKEPVDSIESFRRLVAVMMPIAVHLVRWMFAARQTPNEPAASHVEPEQLEALKEACRFHKVPLPRRAWTVKEVVTKLAVLGGYEVRPDREPGWLVVWRGYREMERLREAFEYAQARQKRGRT